MNALELKGLDKTLYYDRLDNGLDIYLLPYGDKKNYYISYATKYGSDILNFKVDGKNYIPPLGVAHYLEHKMFEEPNGEDPFTFFSYSGSDGNASTSYDSTQYICCGTKKFGENLRYLLQFVNNPYFTTENVEKEKGIIAEEINMYNDIPDYQLEMKLRENLFHNSPRKYDIAGSVEEIKRITKEDLYRCYNAFYTPNNMFILITGSFDVGEAFSIIDECVGEVKSHDIPDIVSPRESKNVVLEHETVYREVEVPKIAIGIKVAKSSIMLRNVEQDLYLNMLTNMLFGASSEFRERVRGEKILNDIYTEWEDQRGYKTFYLYATTTDPDRLLSEVLYELENISIVKTTFERIKKVWIANEVKMIDDIEKTESNLFDDIIHYNKIIPNRIELIRKMKAKTLSDLVKNIDLSHRSILKMLPKEKES